MPRYIISLEKFDEQLDREIGLEEVVMCKDCWYSSVIPQEMQNVGEWHCEYWCAEMHGNDFCSCGKKKERNENG